MHKVTGQLANKPTRGQSSRGLDNSRTGQLAEMFDLQFAACNGSKCYFGQITLFILCQYSIGLELGLVRFNVQIKYSNSMIFLKLAVGELTSPRVIQSAT